MSKAKTSTSLLHASRPESLPLQLKEASEKAVFDDASNGARVALGGPEHLADIFLAKALELSKADWVAFFMSAHPGGHVAPFQLTDSTALFARHECFWTCHRTDQHWIEAAGRSEGFLCSFPASNNPSGHQLLPQMSLAIQRGLLARLLYPPKLQDQQCICLDLSSLDSLDNRQSLLHSNSWLKFINDCAALNQSSRENAFKVLLKADFRGSPCTDSGFKDALLDLAQKLIQVTPLVEVRGLCFTAFSELFVKEILCSLGGCAIRSICLQCSSLHSLAATLLQCASSCPSIQELYIELTTAANKCFGESLPSVPFTPSTSDLRETLAQFSCLLSLTICSHSDFSIECSTELIKAVSSSCRVSSLRLLNFHLFNRLNDLNCLLQSQTTTLRLLFIVGQTSPTKAHTFRQVGSSCTLDSARHLSQQLFSSCTNVTVLSLENILQQSLSNSFSVTFKAASSMPNLVQFRWREDEGGNALTPMLLDLHQSLTIGFKRLKSCWLIFKDCRILLDMTRTEAPEFECISDLLKTIIGDSPCDESVQTFRVSFNCEPIATWLAKIRPDASVCNVVPKI